MYYLLFHSTAFQTVMLHVKDLLLAVELYNMDVQWFWWVPLSIFVSDLIEGQMELNIFATITNLTHAVKLINPHRNLWHHMKPRTNDRIHILHILHMSILLSAVCDLCTYFNKDCQWQWSNAQYERSKNDGNKYSFTNNHSFNKFTASVSLC